MAAKLSAFIDSEWVSHVHERVFHRGETRLIAGVSAGQIETLLRLAKGLTEPFLLLWVLHSPSATPQGRYQSPPLDAAEVRDVLRRYAPLFEQDGRGDIWIHARDPEATLVLDAHDLVYAYGPLDAYVDVLRELGFTEGDPRIPSPHAHEYHAEHEALEHALTQELDWTITELQPGDE